jgi:hypothetical protein
LKTRALVCLVLLVFTQIPPVQAAQVDAEGWTNVGPGVDYKLFLEGTVQYPNRVHVARMDRSHPQVTIESSIAGGRLARNNETTSAMGRRYEGAINFWPSPSGQTTPWGQTNQVIVAINGFYVEKENWVTPQSGQVHSGWYAKRFVNPNGNPVSDSGFAWKFDRSAFIGGCVLHMSHKQALYFPSTDQRFNFTGTNTARTNNSLTIYTPQYDTRTPSAGMEVEVLVELSRPALIIPLNAYVSGTVKEIRQANNGDAPFTIPFDHLVLSGTGIYAGALLASTEVEAEVQISQEITNYVGEECTLNPGQQWTRTYASIGGQFIFLQEGEVKDVDKNREVHPRTAVAYNTQYVYFIVVDGRAPGFSVGMSILQLGSFARDRLQAAWGIAEDGGGSSTMVINNVVVNRPSDPCSFVYLPHMYKDPHGQPPPEVFDPNLSFHSYTGACERRTGNGLLMVAVQDAHFSDIFVPAYDQVETLGTTNIRLGPGSNYAVIATVPGGARGTVLKHANNLDGVWAKDHYWWKVDFEDGVVGWVIEDALNRLTSPLVLWRYLR